MNHTDYNGNYVFFQDGEIIRKENWRRNKIPILTLLFFLNVIIIVGCFQIFASALGDKKTNVICLVIQIICLIAVMIIQLLNLLLFMNRSPSEQNWTYKHNITIKDDMLTFELSKNGKAIKDSFKIAKTTTSQYGVCFYKKDNYYVFIPTEALKEKIVDSNL